MGSGGVTASIASTNASAPTWTWAIPLIVGIIALAGVIATARITYMNIEKQIRSSHALKLAEMRQAWINNLRDAMASFQSYGVTPGLEHLKQREYYEKGTKIELFMNPKDPDYGALQDCLYDFLNATTDEGKSAANPRFVEVCQRILKREWDALKAEVTRAAGGQTNSN